MKRLYRLTFLTLLIIFFLSFSCQAVGKETVDLVKLENVYAKVMLAEKEEFVNVFVRDNEAVLFLPSGTSKYTFFSDNQNIAIQTDDDSIIITDSSRNVNERYLLLIMQSENVGSIFVDTGDVDRLTLDESYKVKYPAQTIMFDEKGNVNVNADLKFIRTRGNGTFYNLKKPYEIKFIEKQSVYGMPKAKKWVLLSNYCDRTLIKDALTYDFANEYTDLASENGEFVDLFLNGEYLGNYYICEKVEVKKNRVDIEDQDDVEHNPNDITGGYLINLTDPRIIDDNTICFTTDSGYIYEIVSPENPTEEQIAYIAGIFNELEEASKALDGIAPSTGRHYSEIIDIDSYVQKYLIVTTFMDPDCDYNSQYYYKNSDAIDGKLYAGPVWDFDTAMQDEMADFEFKHFYLAECLLSHDDINEKVTQTYENTYRAFIEKELVDKVSEYYTKISKSYSMDYERWKGQTRIVNYGYKSLEANMENLILKLKNRISFLDNSLFASEEKFFTVRFGTNGPYQIGYAGTPIGKIRCRWGENGSLFAGWHIPATGEIIDDNTILEQDISVEPIMVDLFCLTGMTKEEMLESGIDVYQFNPDDIEKIANVIDRMKTDE